MLVHLNLSELKPRTSPRPTFGFQFIEGEVNVLMSLYHAIKYKYNEVLIYSCTFVALD